MPASLDARGRVQETLCEGFSVILEPSAEGWVVSAIDNADELLAQFTADEYGHAHDLAVTLAGSDLSDLA